MHGAPSIQAWVTQARLRVMLEAVAFLRHGDDGARVDWRANTKEGFFVVEDGERSVVAAWRCGALIAMSAERDGGSPHIEHTPAVIESAFDGLADDLRDLSKRLHPWFPRAWPDLFWIHAGTQGKSPGTSAFDDYTLSPSEVLFRQDGKRSWLDAVGLTEEEGRVALRWLDHEVAPPRPPTPEDLAIVSWSKRARPLSLADAERAGGLLARVGVDISEILVPLREEDRLRRESPAGLLWTAACAGDIAGIDAALAAGAGVDEPPEGSAPSQSPLQAAAAHGHAAAIAHLLAKGADPDGPTKGGAPLSAAFMRGHPDACAALLAGGASIAALGPSALQRAYATKSVAALRMLVDAGAPIPASPLRDRIAIFALEAGDEALSAKIMGGEAPARRVAAPRERFVSPTHVRGPAEKQELLDRMQRIRSGNDS